MKPEEAIKILKNMLIVNQKEQTAINMAINALNAYWRSYEFETDIPPLDDDGYSERVLLSFDNAIDPDIGEYRQDDDGGAFYNDVDETYAGLGLIVNGWMPLPMSLRREEKR